MPAHIIIRCRGVLRACFYRGARCLTSAGSRSLHMGLRVFPGGQRMVCGVCGGIAEYFNVDPTLVRLAFLLLAAGWGSGLLAYLVAAIIMPEPPVEPYQ